jgi:aryl-alcohol dehydrogenase-like predicted oxidoreductase
LRRWLQEKGARLLSWHWRAARPGDFIVPILGTNRIDRLKEILGALQVQLNQADYEEIECISPKVSAAGGRF